jgi:uncharacterized lipoprotein YddW (UPF0748 family)
MKFRSGILSAFISFLPAILCGANFVYRPVSITLPQPAREFRGAWITAVATNQDWPSKPGLSVADQKAELISLLDRAVQLHLNAIIFQVRPACDAMYASSIEPWSEYISGTMGKPPQPFYDPLAFAIEEAHKRGLELHAWFNPFRALHPLRKSPVAPNHITRTHPELVRSYDMQLWLDPGEPAVREYVLRVVMDVVRRYDVDGVQFDDYFYPYMVKDALGRKLNFPDDASWRKYGVLSGLNHDDWRRHNVNQFVQSVYQSIKATKPWVKFGISPFGIWRPGYPLQVKGLDAYASIYADSRLWFANGWLDYFAPQLYWPIDSPQQNFPVLLKWWAQQNVKGRHLWPGLAAFNVGEKWKADEISRQIEITRNQPGAGGEMFFHLRSLTDNRTLNDVIRAEYFQPALVPASPWLDSTPPDKPNLMATTEKDSGANASWQVGGEPAWKWILQFQINNAWTTEILSASQTNRVFESASPDFISIRAMDRVGNLSAPTTLKKGRLVYMGKSTYIFK